VVAAAVVVVVVAAEAVAETSLPHCMQWAAVEEAEAVVAVRAQGPIG
jgi:hypothetical protein